VTSVTPTKGHATLPVAVVPPVTTPVVVHPRVLATTTSLRATRLGQLATLLSSQTRAAGVGVRAGTVSFIGPHHEVLCSDVAVNSSGRATCRTYLLARRAARVLAIYSPSSLYTGSSSVAQVPAERESTIPAPVTAVGHSKPAVKAPVTSCPTAVAPRGVRKWAETYLAKDVFFWLILVMLGLFAFWQRARGRHSPGEPDDDDSASAEALYATEGE
jgi:hypothetical protein